MQTLLDALVTIEQELIELQLWSHQRPSDAALNSTQPFCIDTLNLPQWLQFILLERLRLMIQAGQTLPRQSGVAPIAEQYFAHSSVNGERLIGLLEQLDALLSSA